MSLAAEDPSFYSTFVKIDDSFFVVLTFLGFVAVLLRIRKNGLLATLAAILGFACLGLSTVYWLLLDFEVVTASNQYVWAASRIVFDLGIVLLIAALVLPKVGAVGSAKTPPVPVAPAWPGQPVPGQPLPGQPLPGQPLPGQPPAYGAYAPPAAPASPPAAPPAGWPPNPQ